MKKKYYKIKIILETERKGPGKFYNKPSFPSINKFYIKVNLSLAPLLLLSELLTKIRYQSNKTRK